MLNELEKKRLSVGARLNYMLKDRRMTVEEFSRLSGLSEWAIYEIINEERPISRYTALKIARVFGHKKEVWISRERSVK